MAEVKVEKIEVVEKPEKIHSSDIAKFEEVKEIAYGKAVISTKSFGEHIDTSYKKKDIYILFETFEDSSSEYKMKKIRLNELDFLEFFDGLKETRVEIVAFYGEYNKCIELAEKFIEKRVTSSIILNEGLVAIKNKSRIALVYKTSH